MRFWAIIKHAQPSPNSKRKRKHLCLLGQRGLLGWVLHSTHWPWQWNFQRKWWSKIYSPHNFFPFSLPVFTGVFVSVAPFWLDTFRNRTGVFFDVQHTVMAMPFLLSAKLSIGHFIKLKTPEMLPENPGKPLTSRQCHVIPWLAALAASGASRHVMGMPYI